jgi:hypothetical protein
MKLNSPKQITWIIALILLHRRAPRRFLVAIAAISRYLPSGLWSWGLVLMLAATYFPGL